MFDTFINILIATIIVSLVSFIGIFILSMQKETLGKVVHFLVALSAGTLLGGAFLHLLPESAELIPIETALICVMAAFCVFFVLERVLHWHHCHEHEGECDVHTFSYMNLFGDAIHNFIDGAMIAASFIISFPLGVSTTIAIIIHEIPQEFSDFGVLIYGGFSTNKALLYNFLTALAAVVGAILTYFMMASVQNALPYILAFGAGGFLYIAASDLVPELHKQSDLKKSLSAFVVFVLGIVLMYVLKMFVAI